LILGPLGRKDFKQRKAVKPGVDLTLERPAQGTITRSLLKSAYATGENGSLPQNVCSTGGGPAQLGSVEFAGGTTIRSI